MLSWYGLHVLSLDIIALIISVKKMLYYCLNFFLTEIKNDSP